MIKACSKIKPIIAVLLVFVMLSAILSANIAFARSIDEIDDGKLMEYTRGMVYYADGSILLISRYNFSKTYSHTFETVVNGETKQISLSYKELIPLILTLAKLAKLQTAYNEDIPNAVTVIEKKYNSLTEMYHDLGITGNEISASPKKETFWETTYISNVESYLADGGRQILENNWLTYAKSAFGIQELDMDIVTFSYCYGTKYSNITSNADVIKTDDKDGMYYHVFKNIDENSSMTLYQTVANSKNWQLVLLLSSVGIAVIGVIILLIIKNKQKN